MLTSLLVTLTGSHAGSSGFTSTPTGKVTSEMYTSEEHELIGDLKIVARDVIVFPSNNHPCTGGTTMSEEQITVEPTTTPAVDVADQIVALITNVDARITLEREEFKLVTSAHHDRMKSLLAERKKITAAIQGVRRRSPGKPAKARKAKVKKDVAA